MTYTQDELETCFTMMDAYAGPEADRVHWLADQFTSYGQALDAVDWLRLEADAAEIIGLWRTYRLTMDAINAGLAA